MGLKWWRKRSMPVSGASGYAPKLELLEARELLSVSIVNNGGNGYAALHFSQTQGFTPPDTCGAAGPSVYVETVNQNLAIYSPKATGASATLDTFDDFWFTVGGLPRADATSELSDPIVVYDDIIGRFIVGDQDVDFTTHVSRFDIAVSKTDTPATLTTADWNFYSIDTTEAGFDADYPGNFGYNADAFVFTLNMFPVATTFHVQVVSISSADLAAGAASPATFHNDVNAFSLRPTAMHDAAPGDPMWLVEENGNNASIDVVAMTNVLSNSATFNFNTISVTHYQAIAFPLNPDGSVITDRIDTRILKAAERNGRLVATQSVGASATQDQVAWYEFDVSGATPTLADQGRIDAGNNTYLTYPGIDINAANQLGVSFMRSGTDSPTDFLSMYVTGRDASDPAGTMQAPVLVPSGTGQTTFNGGGRAGDLSGINVDPVDNTTFWAANEFANTDANLNWGTAVANFKVAPLLPPADMAVVKTGPAIVVAGATATYTITLTNNGPADAVGSVLSDLLPAGSTFVSMVQTAGTDAFTFSQTAGTVTETANATIAAGSSDTFTLTVQAAGNLPEGTPFNDTATVAAENPDPNPNNNTSTVNGTIVHLRFIAVGADAGGGPEVKVYNAQNNALVYDFYAFNPAFTGGVRVAVGDVTGDGIDDIVAAAGPGGGPQVNVYDGATGKLLTAFYAYDPSFAGGVFVAVGDVNGDGHADIITGAGAGGGPHVKVWSGATGIPFVSFMAYDPSFTGGVHVAAADVDGDGHFDIITGAGAGGGPQVNVYSGATGQLVRAFYAYDPRFIGGVFVAAADTNGDGNAEVITGAGPGGGPQVNVYDGPTGALIDSFLAGPAAAALFNADGDTFRSGVRVGAVDPTGTGHADIITGFGPPHNSLVQVFQPFTHALETSFLAFDAAFTGGVFVGGR